MVINQLLAVSICVCTLLVAAQSVRVLTAFQQFEAVCLGRVRRLEAGTTQANIKEAVEKTRASWEGKDAPDGLKGRTYSDSIKDAMATYEQADYCKEQGWEPDPSLLPVETLHFHRLPKNQEASLKSPS